MTNKTINDHISDDKNELDNPNTSSQRRRHLETELSALEQYKENHPNDDHDPTPLELFCDSNPNSLECKLYDV